MTLSVHRYVFFALFLILSMQIFAILALTQLRFGSELHLFFRSSISPSIDTLHFDTYSSHFLLPLMTSGYTVHLCSVRNHFALSLARVHSSSSALPAVDLRHEVRALIPLFRNIGLDSYKIWWNRMCEWRKFLLLARIRFQKPHKRMKIYSKQQILSVRKGRIVRIGCCGDA